MFALPPLRGKDALYRCDSEALLSAAQPSSGALLHGLRLGLRREGFGLWC